MSNIIRNTSLGIAALFIASSAIAAENAEKLLKDRVIQLNSMTANFEQKVSDEDGLELEKYYGNIKLNSSSRSFRMETVKPDQSLLNCNGKDIYYYEPAIEQVSIYSMNKVDKSSPFWIVLSNNDDAYKHFNISLDKKDKNTFILSPKDKKSQNSSYIIHFDKDGLSGVEMTDANGQHVSYDLSERVFMKTLGSVEFVFTVPSGVTVDDQR